MLSGQIIAVVALFTLTTLAEDSAPLDLYADRPYMVNIPNMSKAADRITIQLHYSDRILFSTYFPRPFPHELPIGFPELKPGVHVDAKLVTTGYDPAGKEVETVRRMIRFFSRNYLYDRRAELAGIGIDLYGPKVAVEALLQLHLPVRHVQTLDNCIGSWLICCDVDFQVNPGLYTQLEKLASKGMSILIIPPIKGIIKPNWPAIDEVRFGRRFKHLTYPPIAGFTQTFCDGQQAIEFKKSGNWNWLDCNYGKGRLVFCGWDLRRNAEETPDVIQFFELLFLSKQSIAQTREN